MSLSAMRITNWIPMLSLLVSLGVHAQDVRPVWEELSVLPNTLGVAGPFAGVHNDALIVAGGANFPQPIWESEKVWHDDIYVLQKDSDGYRWMDGGKLPRRIAYGAAVSTPDGVVCMGGNHGDQTLDHVFMLSWDRDQSKLSTTDLPSLPKPCAFTAAAIIGNVVYVAGGQSGVSLDSAMNNLWSLDLSKLGDDLQWQALAPIPGPSRALNLTVQGSGDCIYVISGRRQSGATTQFLTDVWEYNTSKHSWRKRSAAPQCLMAGTAIGWDENRVIVLSGADGSNFHNGASLKDKHPGFPKKAFLYDTQSDRWSDASATPANHVTTIAVKWDAQLIIPSGEIKPKVRSPRIWSVTPRQ